MEPKDYFKKQIIGQLTTRTIDRLSIDGVPTSIKDEYQYDIIDIVVNGGHTMFITNVWENESLQVVLAIHHNFVKEHNIESQRSKPYPSFAGFSGESDTLKKSDIPKECGLTDRADQK